MTSTFQTRADWRALTSAALIGSGIGLGLGAAYLAGGMARAATDHARASRIAEAAAGGFSETVLQHEAAAMAPGVLRIARAHDPFTVAGSAERDRQSAILAERLERQVTDDRPIQSALFLRAAFGSPFMPAAAPFHLTGALDSSRELDCLTQAVYFEARGEGAAGQAAVAQVVLNRVRSPAFPKTVCGVVFQGAARGVSCQFSFACDGSMRRGREPDAWNRAERVAARALSGSVMAAVGNATHFHTINVAPAWGPHLLRVAQVGLHVFYRFGGGVSPQTFLAEAEASAPEQTSQPMFASLAQGGQPTSGPTDYRLASAVITEAPAGAPAALTGPAGSGSGTADSKATASAADAPKPARLTPTSAVRPADQPVKAPASSAS
ncbi:cell wall hydrolase [Phenylobacterium aquaticum]|uniref:cell wall hydrolase n=2 Tax=Phenylobacterium aquaticum TaxID=1763816 RepID=UPI0026EAF835|nr:cell wall hydrolase [Phenylobacterium aquaticum]